MSFLIIISETAQEHLKLHRKAGSKILLKKISPILDELRETPFEGIGYPEPLKYGRTGQWSRRIDQKHRLIYEVFEVEVLVEVISALGHYNDK